MDERLREVIDIIPRQKGFVTEAGCFTNVQILHELTCRMKQDTGGVGIQLGVAKAFDTIPHETIPGALKRKRISQPIVGLVYGSYEKVFTGISHSEGVIEVRLQRGVKQGDPLSPLLFNFILESLWL